MHTAHLRGVLIDGKKDRSGSIRLDNANGQPWWTVQLRVGCRITGSSAHGRQNRIGEITSEAHPYHSLTDPGVEDPEACREKGGAAARTVPKPDSCVKAA